MELFTGPGSSYRRPSLVLPVSGLPPHYLCSASLDGYICVSWMENRNGRLQRCLSLDQSLLT